MPITEIRSIRPSHKSTNLTLLHTAFRIYFEEGMVKSQQEFSTSILGKAPSYFSSMTARQRTPKRAVLERLLNQTRLFLFSCRDNPYIGKLHSVRLTQTHERLDGLANTIESELMLDWRSSLDTGSKLVDRNR